MSSVTKAVILAAGRGARMRALTDDRPKPMIAVRGRPILQHIVEGLREAGVRDVLLVVGYREDVVRDFFGDGEKFGVRVRYERQVTPDGTGRVVGLGRAFTGDEAFLLSYGDILLDPRNYAVLAAMADEEAIVSVKRREDVSQGGAVFVDADFNLVDLREKPKPGEPTSPWYNAGVYAFRPSIYELAARLERSPRGEFELTDAIRALALGGRRVRAYELVGDWADVRDPEVLAELNG